MTAEITAALTRAELTELAHCLYRGGMRAHKLTRFALSGDDDKLSRRVLDMQYEIADLQAEVVHCLIARPGSAG